jgi:hypothetical protein
MKRTYILLIEANQIPTGSRVSKEMGSVVFGLTREISVKGLPGAQDQKIVAENGACFLVHSNGEARAISDKTLLRWHMGFDELREFLDEQEEQ